MYLIAKALYDEDAPELAVINLGTNRDQVEQCIAAARQMQGLTPRPSRVEFPAGAILWADHGVGAEAFDFYAEVEQGEPVLVEELPDLDWVDQSSPRLVICPAEPDEVAFEADLPGTRHPMITDVIDWQKIDGLTVYPGYLIDDSTDTPSR